MIYILFFLCLINITTLFVILSKNMIESVLFLILVFLFTSFLFLLIGAEFLAILVVIIYVGAISILFLFIVMMLNLRVVELHSKLYNYFPIIFIIFILLFLFLLYFILFYNGIFSYYSTDFYLDIWTSLLEINSNLFLIGVVLYNYNNFLVFLSAILLLVSMIGTIVLTIDTDIKKISRKKQNLYIESNFFFKPINLYKDFQKIVFSSPKNKN